MTSRSLLADIDLNNCINIEGLKKRPSNWAAFNLEILLKLTDVLVANKINLCNH